ncbi:eukaryotic translation initiation factor 2-alpha kinase 1 [Ambystoma mexicanum]|uniref:eukaryotic translation initiation factor 2-alpha kinase 1 n=1 Tax=Ambystoma mexicanum TaxID=8296 RepID=UPI0037E8BD9C
MSCVDTEPGCSGDTLNAELQEKKLMKADLKIPLDFPPEEAAALDDSDSPLELPVIKGAPRLQTLSTAIPNQLLLVSLLEHLCYVHEQNPHRSRCLFKLLCQTFTRMGLLSSFAFSDEFSSVRLHHSAAITELLKAAKHRLYHQQELSSGELYVHPSRVKNSLFEAQTSRYLNEFEEIKQLGKGGYGKVYKVRNKLDGQFYAIKKILIKKATRKDCMKVLREVKVLAGLQHTNIVGYHTAWMEHVQPPLPRSKPVPASKIQVLIDSSIQKPGIDVNGIQTLDSSSSSIIFADNRSHEENAPVERLGNLNNNMIYSTERNGCIKAVAEPHMKINSSGLPYEVKEHCLQNNNQERALCFMRQSQELLGWRKEPHFNQDGDSMSSSSSSSEEECPQKEMCLHRQFEMQYHLMLHIQMKLCELSLWDWIVDRNGEHGARTEAADPYHLVDATITLKILQELLEGVYYIHTMGILHRDLKPRNVFLQGPDLHVRIGDFGLACRDIIQDETVAWSKTDITNGSTHTSGVGTSLYAAPEQLQGSHYDFKSDMYSVGMILLELFQPFGTEMERNKVLIALRNGHVPNSFNEQWPIQTKYVKLLTSTVSSQRPSAAHILESELFHNTEKVINNLQKKVVQQEEEIEKLKEQIQLLLRERDHKVETVADPM